MVDPVGRLAGETLSEEAVGRLGEDKLNRLVTAILETPTRRHAETFAVALAQVVGMRITFTSQVVEPRNGTAVLVGEGHRSRCCATGTRTVT